MKIAQALRKYEELMEEHGLIEKGWIPVLDNAKRRFGCCKYGVKQLTLSKYMLPHVSDEDIIDTMLHEIAHALVGHGHGHNYVWKRKAREIGARPERCGTGKVKDRSQLTYKWTGTCPKGHVTNKHKLTRKGKTCSCGKCSNVYNPEFKFTWVQNF